MKFHHEFVCPCVLLSQLNREIEKRPNKRPQLSDLRESGAIEQDAFAVLGLYRDVYYHPETEDKDSAEIIVMKNRNGSTGTIMTRFDGPTMRFYSEVSDMRRTTDQMTSDFSDGFG
jgi:replicative DNA helicase